MTNHSEDEPAERALGEASSDDGVAIAHQPADGSLDPLMLELLVCPLTKKTLNYDAEANELISADAGLAYPVRGGVPILLPSEARSLADEPPGGGSGS